jgi:hypothetical protein
LLTACVAACAFLLAHHADARGGGGVTDLESLPAWGADDVLAALDRAGVVVPRDRALDAVQSYVAAWTAASDTLLKERERYMRLRAAERNAFPASAEQAAAEATIHQRTVETWARVEDALLDELAQAATEATRARIAKIRQSREWARVLASVSALGLQPGGIPCTDIEIVIADALRGDTAARAAADVVLEQSRVPRLAAARRVAPAAARGQDEQRRILDEAGVSALTGEDIARIFERDRADPGPDASSPREDDAPDAPRFKPGSQAERIIAAMEAGGRAWSAALARPVAQFVREQVKTLHAVLDALPPEARDRVARRMARDLAELASGFPGIGLYRALARTDLSPACEACLQSARDAWRERFPRLVMDALDAYAAGAERAMSGDYIWRGGLDCSEAFGEKSAEVVAGLLAGCAGACGGAALDDRETRAWTSRRLRGLPEFDADAVEAWTAEMGADPEDGEAPPVPDESSGDPFGLGRDITVLGQPPKAAGFEAALDRLGVSPERRVVAMAVHAAFEAEWSEQVQAALERFEERMDELQSGRGAGDGEVPPPGKDPGPVRAAFAALVSAAAGCDDRLVTGVAAAAGLSDRDVQALRMWRHLGDARSQAPLAGEYGDETMGGLRLNPFDALLSTDLSPSARDAATQAFLRQAPALRARFDAWLRTRFEAEVARRLAVDRLVQRMRGSGPAEDKLAAREEWHAELTRVTGEVDAARLAYETAARAAIDEACQAVPPDAAAALRETALMRRFPFHYLNEALVRATVADVLARLPAEDPDAHLAVARVSDAWLAVAAALRADAIRYADLPHSAFAWRWHGDPDEEAANHMASERVNIRMAAAGLLLQLAVERLATAVELSHLEASPKFRGLAERAGVELKSLRARAALSSAP